MIAGNNLNTPSRLSVFFILKIFYASISLSQTMGAVEGIWGPSTYMTPSGLSGDGVWPRIISMTDSSHDRHDSGLSLTYDSTSEKRSPKETEGLENIAPFNSPGLLDDDIDHLMNEINLDDLGYLLQPSEQFSSLTSEYPGNDPTGVQNWQPMVPLVSPNCQPKVSSKIIPLNFRITTIGS